MASGFLRVVSPTALNERDKEAEAERAQREQAAQDDQFATDLNRYIRDQWAIARDHRSSYSGLEQRLVDAMRMFNGEYDPNTLADIQRFGGSEVYARLVGAKCRSATALLRDVFFASDRPWELDSTPDPDMPKVDTIDIEQQLAAEAEQAVARGLQLTEEMLTSRRNALREERRAAEQQKALDEAKKAEAVLDDYLVEGNFYDALAELLVDLPLFPFACLKGPSVRIVPQLQWKDGKPEQVMKARLFWNRVSPFDLFWTPGASNIADADIFERLRWSRRDLHDLLGLPGWNEEAVQAVLDTFDDRGLRDWLMPSDETRAQQEGRESPNWNRSNMIDALEFHGAVQGKKLLEWGMEGLDEKRDYFVQAWVVGQYVLKVHLAPSPRKRHPYFVTSFDKVPGTVAGNALPDILNDVQQAANATLRALINNMGMASGPQVVINDLMTNELDDSDEIYPWKRWHVEYEPGQANSGNSPIEFYQPSSNAQELLHVYQVLTQIGDELSAIPRYITGSGATGGAGRTASGLSMLMGNANKLLHNVVANVDRDIVHQTVQSLYDLVMLTRASEVPLRGDEEIRTRGVATAMAREVERARQLEFLNVTGNPVDMQITGLEGRASVLREVARGLGMDGEVIVPPRAQMRQRAQEAVQAQAAQAAAEAQGDQAPAPAGDTGPRENLVQPNLTMGQRGE